MHQRANLGQVSEPGFCSTLPSTNTRLLLRPRGYRKNRITRHARFWNRISSFNDTVQTVFVSHRHLSTAGFSGLNRFLVQVFHNLSPPSLTSAATSSLVSQIFNYFLGLTPRMCIQIRLLTNWLSERGQRCSRACFPDAVAGPGWAGSLCAWFPPCKRGDSGAHPLGAVRTHASYPGGTGSGPWHLGCMGVSAAGFSSLVLGGLSRELLIKVGKGRSRRELCSPSVPTCFQIIPVVSLVITYLCTLAMSRNLGGGAGAWACPQVPIGLPSTSLGPSSCLSDTGKPAFTSPLCHQAAGVRTARGGGAPQWSPRLQHCPLQPRPMQTGDQSTASEDKASPFLVPMCPS